MKLIGDLKLQISILCVFYMQVYADKPDAGLLRKGDGKPSGGNGKPDGGNGKPDGGKPGKPDGGRPGKPTHDIPGLPSDKPVASDDTGFLELIKNYGCWCKFGEDTLRGIGKPVDYIDKLCQDLTMCLRCPKIHKVNATADVCITSPYNTLNIMSQDFTDTMGVEEKCKEINTHECGVHNCICYSKFDAGFVEILKHPAKIVKLALIKSKYQEHFDNCAAEEGEESSKMVDEFGCPEDDNMEEETCSEDAFVPPEDDVILKKITITNSCFKPAKFTQGEKKPIAITTSSKPKNPIKYFDQDVKPVTSPGFCRHNMFYNVNDETVISKSGPEMFCVTVDSTWGEANDAGIQEALVFFRPCKNITTQIFMWKGDRFIQTRDDGLFSCLSFNKASKTKKLLTMFAGADKAAVYKLCTGKFMVDKFIPLADDDDTEEMPTMKMDDSTDSLDSADMEHMDHTMIEEKCGTDCGDDDTCYETCLKVHFESNKQFCVFHCGGDKCCREQCSESKPVRPKPPAEGKPGRPGRPGVMKPSKPGDEHRDCMVKCIESFKDSQTQERGINNIKILTKVAKVQAMEQCLEQCDQDKEDGKTDGNEVIDETPTPDNGNMQPKPNQVRQLGHRILGN